ncbi:mammalian cell entry protein [Mycolicibacterium moriokaense]|uniref:Mce family protein Mce3C n=1 Tax=Mycolicibacterium moriokaense TaxID=39691 RepID=A0AAD1M911_9MYCO|nr:MCE family protein [Mycolicibacterium moriokaense]MCV7041961.1 MCE family protein [Mycolicibacterium moriokaense]ORB25052.1 mammalian cell entry protein [Mycolicibacterium moriokaense]BBX04728.1 Mce family protein Mce3C [Mycolicibacterium moriokaense]
MRSFSERSPLVIGAIGITLVAGVVLASLQYKKLPFINSSRQYSAYFTEAGGLRSGAAVQVAGFRVGEVSSVKLDGQRVLVTFEVDKSIDLGDRTEAAVKTKSLLGAKILEVSPRGDGELSEAIPTDRTTAPYQLPDALGDLAATVGDLNTTTLSDALATLSQTFADTPPDLEIAVRGVARFSQSLNERDKQLRELLANANKVTTVLAERSDQVVHLVSESNSLLAELATQSSALDRISLSLSALASQVSGFISDNRAELGPALEKLNGVLAIVDDRNDRVQTAIKLLNNYVMSLGESVASGPFFKAYVANLLPGQFVQPFVEAAFSDLGLDPNVLLPSERIDPPTGQPATPALPMPLPRTGQGGEPHLTLPDAITGKPGDPRYPYRQPPPIPTPGGPPPGPPAGSPSEGG